MAIPPDERYFPPGSSGAAQLDFELPDTQKLTGTNRTGRWGERPSMASTDLTQTATSS